MTNKVKNLQNRRKTESGLTLIEVSIGLVLLGLVVGVAIQGYLDFRIKRNYIDLRTELVSVKTAMDQFYYDNNRFPCPADLTLAPNTLSYGEESYSNTNTCGDPANPAFVVGAIPFKTLSIDESLSLDSWGNKITYTVTGIQALETAHPIRAALPGGGVLLPPGVLQVDFREYRDTDADNIKDTILTRSEFIHNYVLNSHGQIATGAFSRQGILVAACPGATNRDEENCDNDGLFWSGHRGSNVNVDASATPQIYSDLPNADFFDDITLSTSETPTEQFQYARNSIATGPSSTAFTRTPMLALNVPLNANNTPLQMPQADVDVMSAGGIAGTIILESDPATTGLDFLERKDGNAYTQNICNEDMTSCFDPGFFTVETIGCTTVTAQSGIYSNALNCNTAYDPGIRPDCAGRAITGINAIGAPTCN